MQVWLKNHSPLCLDFTKFGTLPFRNNIEYSAKRVFFQVSAVYFTGFPAGIADNLHTIFPLLVEKFLPGNYIIHLTCNILESGRQL